MLTHQVPIVKIPIVANEFGRFVAPDNSPYQAVRRLASSAMRGGINLGFSVNKAFRQPFWIEYVSKSIWVLNSCFVRILSHADQPATEIIKAIIRRAAIYEIRSRPKVRSIRSSRQSVKDVVPFYDFIGRELGQLFG